MRAARGEPGAGRGLDLPGILRERAGEFQRAPAPRIFARHGGGMHERRFRAAVERNIRALEQVENVQHVLGALRRPDVAGNDGDPRDGHLRGAAQQHHHRRAIVAEQSRIGVDDYGFAAARPQRGKRQNHRHETIHEIPL